MIADELRALVGRTPTPQEIFALADRVEAVERDAARMQFAEMHSWPADEQDVIYINVRPFPGGTLRAAIDAAIKEQADANG